MKNLLIIAVVLFATLDAKSQSITRIPFYQWSNPMTFQMSTTPLVKGKAELSDSLSRVYEGKQFYEYNGEYYAIDSWADYYLWFTKKYWHQFENPVLYEFYYHQKDDLLMAKFVATNFIGNMYPAFVSVEFYQNAPDVNKMNNAKYFAYTKSDQKRLLRSIENGQAAKKNPANSEQITFVSQKSSNKVKVLGVTQNSNQRTRSAPVKASKAAPNLE